MNHDSYTYSNKNRVSRKTRNDFSKTKIVFTKKQLPVSTTGLGRKTRSFPSFITTQPWQQKHKQSYSHQGNKNTNIKDKNENERRETEVYDEHGIQREIRNPNPNTRTTMIVEMRSLPQNSMKASEREWEEEARVWGGF